MRCPKLSELPAPPTGKTGWPWTEESGALDPNRYPDDCCPAITVVTPSFNQGQFLEETIRSVLLQAYPNLEYFVLDGGSTDGSVEILQKYDRWITFWVSEPDRGQSSAVNRGLRMGTGTFATWINSDDMLYKSAITNLLLECGALLQNAVYVGGCIHVDKDGVPEYTHFGNVQTLEDLVCIRTRWRSAGGIDQPAVLFPRQLALEVGALNEANHNTMDYELWGRLLLHGAPFVQTHAPLGIFRHHASQKTSDSIKQTQSLLEAAGRLIEASTLSIERKQQLCEDLAAYEREYPEHLWRHTGRLAKSGLPPGIVTLIRAVKSKADQVGRRLSLNYK
jgi:GT2 family glycosyltransferase